MRGKKAKMLRKLAAKERMAEAPSPAKFEISPVPQMAVESPEDSPPKRPYRNGFLKFIQALKDLRNVKEERVSP